jgi:hypothetical protein
MSSTEPRPIHHGYEIDAEPERVVPPKTQLSGAPAVQSPCVGCRNQLRCKSLSIACSALAVFESVGGSAARFAYAPRQPTAAIYERIHTRPKRTPAPPVYRRPVASDDQGQAAK